MRYLKPAAFLICLVGGSVPFLSRTAMATDDGPSIPEGNSDHQTAQSENRSSHRTETASTSALSDGLGKLLDSAAGEVDRALLNSVTFSDRTRLPLLSARDQPQATGALMLDPLLAETPQFSDAMTTASSERAAPISSKSDTSPVAVSADTSSTEGFVIEVQAQAPNNKTLRSMDDFRRLVEDAQAQAPEADEELPTLEDVPPSETPPAPDPTPTTGAEPVEVEPGPESAPADDAADPAPAEPAPPRSPAVNGAELTNVRESLVSDPNPLSVPVFPEEVNVERNPLVTLDEAIELAYRNNQALQTSLLQLEQAEFALDEQRAALLPSVSTSADLQTSQNTSGLNQTTLGGDVTVNYDIITGGGRQASIRSAELQVEVSELAVEAQQEQLRLVTANLYYALQEAIEQIRINQAFVDEAERNLRDSELRQDVGVGTRFDVLRAEVQLANAQQALVQAQFNEDIARRDISRLLNLPPTSGLQTTPVERAENWPLDLEESILLAFQNRSELEQQLLQADISEEQRQIALSATRPRLSLVAQYGLQNILNTNSAIEAAQEAEGEFKDTFLVGLNFNWTLFNGGASRAAARQQEVGAQIAEEQFSETLDEVRFDVEQAFFNIQANEANITTSNSAVIQAEAALELANLRLQAGVGTQLDVLTAQSELTQAQVNNVTAILGYNRALVAIQRAISNLEL